jgi:hypothetical protein
MLTAAVRDLHVRYPGRFVTDARTACPDLWENNPWITSLPEDDPEVEQIDCSYPLINRCNRTPYHCLHGFIEFLNQRLGLEIKPTAFKGDIHLSEREKVWYSQVHEVTRHDTPFWIVAAGGKYDLTIKWWQTERYQEVIDHFKGKLLFVQVGQRGHHHPKLDGVIDLRGKTSLRQLVRLVYHSRGVLCGVTGLMHLAAAVETKRGRPSNRPCVVVAGGREPAHWEAYPDHQFISTNGALPCCAGGGCWKDRTEPLRDGDRRDRRNNRCVDVVDGLPHCMEMITASEVIRRIELYYQGGVIEYLSPSQQKAAQKGVRVTAKNDFDKQTLNLQSAGMACERFLRGIPVYPDCYRGRGIVICGGGARYFTNAWVCINMLRRLCCTLPIQVWYLGDKEMDRRMMALLKPLGVECVDAMKVRKQFPVRTLNGWELKPYATLHSPFREVLLLDADNVAVVNPEFLFGTRQFLSTGAIFWPDFGLCRNKKARPIWRSCGLRPPNEREFETGQIVVDKERCWRALCLTLFFNENSDFYYRYMHGDKETFHLAFRMARQPYALVPKPVLSLEGTTMCQHDFEGRRLFQHRNSDKWDLFQRNRRVKDFWFEEECRKYVARLQGLWDGGMRRSIKSRLASAVPVRRTRPGLRMEAVIVSSAGRNQLLEQTIANLARTDWGEAPAHVEICGGNGEGVDFEQAACAYMALRACLERSTDYVLFLKDALDFNRHLRHNLAAWSPLKSTRVRLASLYNPRVRELACDLRNNARIVEPNFVFSSRALLISRVTVKYLVRHWNDSKGGQDFKFFNLAARMRRPIFYHAPSLAQQTEATPPSAANDYPAMDFDPDWRA